MDKEIKRAKIFNYTVAAIFLLIFICIIAFLGMWKWSRTFTVSKWMNNPEDRYKIVSNMLSKHEIVGMTEYEIIELLGEEHEKAPESFKYPRGEYLDENTLTYYLGVDFMDNNWLIIPIENGVAIESGIGVT